MVALLLRGSSDMLHLKAALDLYLELHSAKGRLPQLNCIIRAHTEGCYFLPCKSVPRSTLLARANPGLSTSKRRERSLGT